MGLGLTLGENDATTDPHSRRDTPTPMTRRNGSNATGTGIAQAHKAAVETIAEEVRATTPATEYTFDDMDMDALEKSIQESERRYESPTSEDWRNLSVHAESVDSDDLAGAIGDTIGRDKVDLENFITNGIDRYGDTIPGQEQWREEYRARKRPRAGSPAQDTDLPRVHSVRFRKYRAKPAGYKPRDLNNTVTNTTGSPPNLPSPQGNTGTVALNTHPRVHNTLRLDAGDKGKAPERRSVHNGHEHDQQSEVPTYALRTTTEPPPMHMEVDSAPDERILAQTLTSHENVSVKRPGQNSELIRPLACLYHENRQLLPQQ